MYASFVYRLLQDGKLPLSRQALKKQIKGNAEISPRNYFLIPLDKKIKLPNSLFGDNCLVLTSHLSIFEYFDTTVTELSVLHHTLKCQLGNQRFSIHVYYDKNAVYIGYGLTSITGDACPIALLNPMLLRQVSAQMCGETAKKLLTTTDEEFESRSDIIEQELTQLEMLSQDINFDCPQDRKRYQQPANHLVQQMDDLDPYRTQKKQRHQLFRSMVKQFNSKHLNLPLAQTTEQHYQQLIASVSAKMPADINPIQCVLTELKIIEELIELAEEAPPSLNYTAALFRLQKEKITEVERLFTELLHANDLESAQQLIGYIKKISVELFFEVVSRNYIEMRALLRKFQLLIM